MKSSAVINPNLGLYFDRPRIAIGPNALQDGLNFRVKQGKLSNLNLGWNTFGVTLNGPAVLIGHLHLRSGLDELVFGSLTDLYSYSPSGGGSVKYITPIYNTGTVSASGTAVTGSSTLWNTKVTGAQWFNAKSGDEISFGSNAVVLPTATWYTIKTVNSDTSITLNTSAGTVGAGTAYTIRRKFTGQMQDLWEFETFVNASPENEDQIFLTNGVDNVMRWNGTDAQVTILTGLGFTCKNLRQFRNMMLYFNLNDHGTTKPTDMVNSDVGSPSLAGDAGTGLSEQFRVHAGDNEIMGAERLGDYLAIYSRDRITMVYFTGDDLVFVFRNAVEGYGLIARKGIAVYPAHHQFVSTDSLYTFDGSIAKPDATHVWREILRTQDPTRSGNIFTVLDEQNGDQIWSVPLTTDPGSGTITSPPANAYTEHYLENTATSVLKATPRPYSKRSFPFTAAGFYTRQAALTWDQLVDQWQSYSFRWNDQFFAAQFPIILVGDVNGVIYQLNATQDANGAALTSFVKFGRRAVVEGHMRGMVSRVYPYTTTFNNNLTVTVHMANFADGPSTIDASFNYDQTFPEGTYFVPVYRRGRYMDLEFGSSIVSGQWEISGYDVEVRAGGMR